MYPSEAPKKKCGTCKWFGGYRVTRDGGAGICEFPIPALPLAVTSLFEDAFLLSQPSAPAYSDETNCPTWEEADATHHPHPAE